MWAMGHSQLLPQNPQQTTFTKCHILQKNWKTNSSTLYFAHVQWAREVVIIRCRIRRNGSAIKSRTSERCEGERREGAGCTTLINAEGTTTKHAVYLATKEACAGVTALRAECKRGAEIRPRRRREAISEYQQRRQIQTSLRDHIRKRITRRKLQ